MTGMDYGRFPLDEQLASLPALLSRNRTCCPGRRPPAPAARQTGRRMAGDCRTGG